MKILPSILSALALSAFFVSSTGCGSDDGGGKQPTATPTNTLPSTSTPQPTSTPIPPTNTPIPPTNTPVPPTNTAVPTPTATMDTRLDISVCAPDAGPFSTTIDHPYFPLPVGTKWILQGEEDGEAIRVEITSLDETEVVADVETRVIEEREWEDGELVEVSRNFFVRAPDGSVCYYGEDVDDYEDGEIVGHDGAWRAGENGNLPGILMPANPQVGQVFQQEVAIGIAEDTAEITAVGETVEVPLGTFTDTVRFLESSPLDSGTSDKVFARDVGLIVDDVVERGPLIPDTVPEFDASDFSNPTLINNPFFPLVPGTTHTYLGETEDEAETIVVEVLDETRVVADVLTRVVRDRVFVDGLLIEDTHDWFAQDDDGNVWYMGEEVDNYEYDDDDNVISIDHDGAWEAGKDVAEVGENALPGYQMKAAPTPGDVYAQEYYPGEAEDMAEVLALNVAVTLDDDSSYSCLQTRDFTPLEPDVNELKYYAPGVGLVLEEEPDADESAELKAIFLTGPETIPSFNPAAFSNPTLIDNPYFPLVPGTTFNYEGETEDGIETTVVEVLEETREVAGVLARVVRDRVYLEDLLIEDTHDWYAQDDDGNVWYMGEEVDNYNYDDEDDLIDIDHDGAWEAGKDVAEVGSIAIPGYVMKASPMAGESYRQEYYAGEAEDMGYVVRLDATVEIDGETICDGDCLQTVDWNPLEPDTLEYKFYAAGIGVILEEKLGSDEVVELQSVE